jgi:hypothetical protein
MHKADGYRAYAAECMRLASTAGNEKDRLALIDMAQIWFRLAEQTEKNSQADLVYETPPPPHSGDEAE